jgi:putative endonuclease
MEREKVPVSQRVPFVYILRCRDDSLYTGIAKDMYRRLKLHQAGKGAKYTAMRLPVELAWVSEVSTWSDAMREERRIKRLSRVQKLLLIAHNTSTPPP